MLFKTKNMLKKSSLLYLLFLSSHTYAQVGINITTPTETLDVNGTARVRSLPDDGTIGIRTTPSGTASANADQLFTAKSPLVVDANGVLGKAVNETFVPNSATGPTFNTTNTSEAFFVVKRFLLYDNIGGLVGRYHPNYVGGTTPGIFNGDTGMDVSKWQAMISNISFKFLTSSDQTHQQFAQNDYFNYRLKGDTAGTWKIIGDIINLQEQAYVDVLFIKSDYVAAENRSQ